MIQLFFFCPEFFKARDTDIKYAPSLSASMSPQLPQAVLPHPDCTGWNKRKTEKGREGGRQIAKEGV